MRKQQQQQQQQRHQQIMAMGEGTPAATTNTSDKQQHVVSQNAGETSHASHVAASSTSSSSSSSPHSPTTTTTAAAAVKFQVTTTSDQLLSVAVEDQVLVGSDEILSSLHVSEGPGRIATSPVPSIYYDDRGEIHRIRVGGKRVNMLSSKKDVMRGGYLLATTSYVYVLSGTVEVWSLNDSGTAKAIYERHEFFSIPAWTPFILHFLQDTQSVEYWEGEFRCFYYHPYRRVLELQNSVVAKANNHIGQLQRLLPEEQSHIRDFESLTTSAWFWGVAGVVVGCMVGTLFTISAVAAAGGTGGGGSVASSRK